MKSKERNELVTAPLRIKRTKVLALIFAVGACSAVMAQSRYRVTDEGTLTGGNFGCAMGLNNRGWEEVMDTLLDPVSGNTLDRASLRVDGLKIDLGTFGGPNSWTNWGGINESGDAVGYAETPKPDPNGEDFCFFGTQLTCRPFLWHEGKMKQLPTLGGNNGQASAINSRGQVVGTAETSMTESGCSFHTAPPVLWQNGKAQALPTVSGDRDGFAYGINNAGQAVGDTGVCTSSLHAVSWQDGMANELPGLGGVLFTVAFAISNHGEIAGASDLSGDATFHATIWQNGMVSDLGTITGDYASYATGLNDAGQVVGTSFDSNFNPAHAFLWQNGMMTDLSTLFPPDSYLFPTMANKINSRGQISGMATDLNDGTIHAFLATPAEADSNGAPASPSETKNAPKVPLPENVRARMLRSIGLGHFESPSGTR
jgi:probable HAF family extracellular repeat protein